MLNFCDQLGADRRGGWMLPRAKGPLSLIPVKSSERRESVKGAGRSLSRHFFMLNFCDQLGADRRGGWMLPRAKGPLSLIPVKSSERRESVKGAGRSLSRHFFMLNFCDQLGADRRGGWMLPRAKGPLSLIPVKSSERRESVKGAGRSLSRHFFMLNFCDQLGADRRGGWMLPRAKGPLSLIPVKSSERRESVKGAGRSLSRHFFMLNFCDQLGADRRGGWMLPRAKGPLSLIPVKSSERRESVKGARFVRGLRPLDRSPPFWNMDSEGTGARVSGGLPPGGV